MRLRILINAILFLFSTSSFEQQKISTKELESIANRFGIDSVLQSTPFAKYIYHIDTTAALSLALKCVDLNTHSLQLYYFSDIGRAIKNTGINSSATGSLQSYKSLLTNTTAQRVSFVIPDELFAVLAFQEDTSTIPVLTEEFEYWERCADSIKIKYPSAIKRFFQSLKGTPPTEQLFSDCKQNSFKLAWVLNKFGASGFSVERVNAIKRQLVPYLRDYNMDRYIRKSVVVTKDTISLVKDYVSIDEITLDEEPAFKKVKEDLEGEMCWKRLFTNHNLGLYEIGCQWAPLAGRGNVLKLELIDHNKLVVSVIGSWIS